MGMYYLASLKGKNELNIFFSRSKTSLPILGINKNMNRNLFRIFFLANVY